MPLHPQAQQIAPHIEYERVMLLSNIQRWQRVIPTDQWELNSATLESMAVHARNLYSFMANLKIRNSDTIADDFLDTGTFTHSFDYIVANLNNIHRQIAHITYHRLAGTTNWDPNLILNEINTNWTNFMTMLQPLGRDIWFHYP